MDPDLAGHLWRRGMETVELSAAQLALSTTATAILLTWLASDDGSSN
jgi:hypothetical protein